MAEEHESVLDVTVKRQSKKKSGFEVERRDDGFYYLIKIPSGFKQIGVGDRVMEINGTTYLDFKHERHANDLIDCFRLEVVPLDDDEDGSGDEQYEEVDRDRSRGARDPANSVAAMASTAKSAYDNGRDRGSRGRNNDENSDGDYDHDSDKDQTDGSIHDAGANDGDDDDRYVDGNDTDGDSDDHYDGDANDDYYPDEDARAAARANAAKRNQVGNKSNAKDFDRPYISRYNPNDRFMITVTKEYADEDSGLHLVEFISKRRTDIYVAEVERGPFFKTALDRGDKILSINGKKHPKELKSIEHARALLSEKTKATVFAMRPDPTLDEGYKWVMENT